MPVGYVRGDPAPSACSDAPGGTSHRGGIFLSPGRGVGGERRKSRRYNGRARRSGRVAEGGALLRRYVGEYLHRGFESLLLRYAPQLGAPRGGVAERSNAAVSKTVIRR